MVLHTNGASGVLWRASKNTSALDPIPAPGSQNLWGADDGSLSSDDESPSLSVVKPCSQADRSEMGGKAEQNQLCRPTFPGQKGLTPDRSQTLASACRQPDHSNRGPEGSVQRPSPVIRPCRTRSVPPLNQCFRRSSFHVGAGSPGAGRAGRPAQALTPSGSSGAGGRLNVLRSPAPSGWGGGQSGAWSHVQAMARALGGSTVGQ